MTPAVTAIVVAGLLLAIALGGRLRTRHHGADPACADRCVRRPRRVARSQSASRDRAAGYLSVVRGVQLTERSVLQTLRHPSRAGWIIDVAASRAIVSDGSIRRSGPLDQAGLVLRALSFRGRSVGLEGRVLDDGHHARGHETPAPHQLSRSRHLGDLDGSTHGRYLDPATRSGGDDLEGPCAVSGVHHDLNAVTSQLDHLSRRSPLMYLLCHAGPRRAPG